MKKELFCSQKAKWSFLSLCLFFLFFSQSPAQFVFQKAIDLDPSFTERVGAVGESPFGGFIYVGDLENKGSNWGDDLFVVHTDAQGDWVWANFYELPNYDLDGNAIAVAPDGGAMISGNATDSNGFDQIFAFRIDASGALSWQRKFDNTYNREAWAWNASFEDSLGHWRFFVIGSRLDVPTNSEDAVVLKVDDSGNEIWSKTYGIPFRHERGTQLFANSFGYYLVIDDYDPATGKNFFVLAIHPDGAPFWLRRLTWSGDAHSVGLAVLPDDDILLCGNVYDNVGQDWDIGVMRWNFAGTNNGSVLWSWIDDQAGDQFVRDAEMSTTGNWGIMTYNTAQGFAEILSLDTLNGNVLWKERYTGWALNDPRSLAPTADGGFMGLGVGTQDVNLWKVDQNGFSGCAQSSIPVIKNIETPSPWLIFIGANNNFNPSAYTYFPLTAHPIQTDICCGSAGICVPGTAVGDFHNEIAPWPGDQNLYDVDIQADGQLLLSGTNQFGLNGRDNMLAFSDTYGHVCRGADNDHGGDEWYLDLLSSDYTCGGHFTTGFGLNGGNLDMQVSRLDGNGQALWTYGLGGTGMEQGYELVEYATYQNGVLVNSLISGGFTQSYGSGGDDGLLLELDESGNFLNAAAVGFTSNERFYGLKKTTTTSAGTLIGCGEADDPNNPGTLDAWVCWMQQDGTPIASARFGMDYGDDIAHESVQDGNQNTYVVGQYRVVNTADWNIFLAKFDASHNLLWYNLLLLGTGDDIGYSIDYDPALDSLVIAGSSYSMGGVGKSAILLQVSAQTSAIGKLRYFDGPGDEAFLRVRLDAYGRPVAVGNSNSYNGSDFDGYYVRLQNWNAGCIKDTGFSWRNSQRFADTNLPTRIALSPGQFLTQNYLDLQISETEVCASQSPGGGSGGSNKQAEHEQLSPVPFQLEVYPQPSQGQVHLNYQAEEQANRSLEVLDLQGRQMRRYSLISSKGSMELDLSSLSTGVYFLRISGGPEGPRVQRISIQR